MRLYSKLSDYELTDLLKTGDQLAFTTIYHRYERLLFLHAYKKLHDPEEAKDVVHDLFAALWNKHETFQLTTSLSGYLYTALRNRILNLFSHKSIQSGYIQAIQQFADQNIQSTTDQLVRYNELLTLIDREIARLPKKMRYIFELSRMENLSHREVAEQTGLSEKTVKKQVQNALRLLRLKISILIFILYLFS